MKRAGVYVFYDKDGIVDRYVPYYIRELHKVVDYIVVVVNGTLTPEGRRALADVADDMFVRENKGYDSWAYKAGIDYIGWEKIQEYDEIVLANSSTYGPVFPFNESFDKMEDNNCDFWGMTSIYENRKIKTWGGTALKWGYRPDAIASNFLVFKKSVLNSFEFRSFWENLHEIKTYFDASVYFESTLINDLRDAGFIGRAMDREELRYRSPVPAVYSADVLLADYRIPIIRRKAFYDPNGPLDYCTDVPRRLMQYISENTDYDSDLIWENLLRTNNLYDLKNWFNWNIILPQDFSHPLQEEKRIAVIFHTYYDDIMEQYFHNIESFPDGTDFYFTTDTEEKIAALRKLLTPLNSRFNIRYRKIENRGRDVSALLVGCRDVVLEGGYDLICFMHDKKAIGNTSEYRSAGKYYSDCCFENVAPSADYVNNVIEMFERQPRLGVAVPPPPSNANFFTVIGGHWSATGNYENVKRLLNELNLNVPLDKSKPPVAPYGSVFWFRPEALIPLFNKKWGYGDFSAEPMASDGTISHAIERAYGFIAQSQGYYTSVILNMRYSEREITYLTYIAYSYIHFFMHYVSPEQRPYYTAGNARFIQLVREKINGRPSGAQQKIVTGKTNLAAAASRSSIKRFFRAICPIGLWNLIRRFRCEMIGGVYVEPYVQRGAIKNIIRACTPRFIWDALRRARCRENGWVFVED